MAPQAIDSGYGQGKDKYLIEGLEEGLTDYEREDYTPGETACEGDGEEDGRVDTLTPEGGDHSAQREAARAPGRPMHPAHYPCIGHRAA